MSLINEALKRAELDKRPAGRRRLDDAPAEVDAGLEAWPAHEEEISRLFGKKQTSLRGAVILGLCAIAAVAAVMYWSLPPDQNGPDLAQAGDSTIARPEVEASKREIPAHKSADASRLEPQLAPPVQPNESRPETRFGRQTHLTQRDNLTPAAHQGKRPPEKGSGTNPKPATPSPDKPAPASGFAAEQFKLGGILQSGSGAYAIINNHLVLVGDEIDGARVVDIQKHHVVLVKDGQRLTLRM